MYDMIRWECCAHHSATQVEDRHTKFDITLIDLWDHFTRNIILNFQLQKIFKTQHQITNTVLNFVVHRGVCIMYILL